MKKLFAWMLAAVMLVSLAACNEAPPPETTVPTQTTTPKKPAEPTDPLSVLRSEMEPPVMAVADFGFPNLSGDFEIMDYLLDEYPQWMSAHDFILNMPQERIIRTGGYDDWCNLVCIVPKDPKASVTVRVMQYLDKEPYTKESVAYSSQTGEPILLLANISEAYEVSVEVIDSTGRGLTWLPYWESCDPIPEGDYGGAHVMYFTPDSEKSAYQRALDYGWVVPDGSFMRNHMWKSSTLGYQLELYYTPSEIFDGEAYIWEYDYTGEDGYDYFEITYQGHWCFEDGKLHLKLTGLMGDVVEGDFPILTDPDGYDWLGIYRTEAGVGLPQFFDDMTYDDLEPMGGDAISAFAYAISQGWQEPTLEELVNSQWMSDCRYAMDLLDDGVSGDNAGEVIIYDVADSGAYTVSYTGSWSFEDGMLHLMLVPKNADGYFIDDSFPILMLDEQLWLGRNEYGNCLPYFYSDMMADILWQPKG